MDDTLPALPTNDAVPHDGAASPAKEWQDDAPICGDDDTFASGLEQYIYAPLKQLTGTVLPPTYLHFDDISHRVEESKLDDADDARMFPENGQQAASSSLSAPLWWAEDQEEEDIGNNNDPLMEAFRRSRVDYQGASPSSSSASASASASSSSSARVSALGHPGSSYGTPATGSAFLSRPRRICCDLGGCLNSADAGNCDLCNEKGVIKRLCERHALRCGCAAVVTGRLVCPSHKNDGKCTVCNPKAQAPSLAIPRCAAAASSSAASSLVDGSSAAGRSVLRRLQEPNESTAAQISFLKEIDYARGCNCKLEDDFFTTDETFATQEEAQQYASDCVLKVIARGKNEKCACFTVLEKNGRYHVLETMADHKIRPIRRSGKHVYPSPGVLLMDQTHQNDSRAGRILAMKCCDTCADVEVGMVLNPDVTSELEEVLQKISDDKGPYQMTSARDHARTLLPAFLKQLGAKRVLVHIPAAVQLSDGSADGSQDGWSLHHGEMQALVFSIRNDYAIVAIYLDRQPCAVCGPTLFDLGVDPEQVYIGAVQGGWEV